MPQVIPLPSGSPRRRGSKRSTPIRTRGADLSVLIDSWVRALEAAGRTPKTIGAYTDTARMFLAWLPTEGAPTGVERIEAPHVRRFLLQSTSRRRAHDARGGGGVGGLSAMGGRSGGGGDDDAEDDEGDAGYGGEVEAFAVEQRARGGHAGRADAGPDRVDDAHVEGAQRHGHEGEGAEVAGDDDHDREWSERFGGAAQGDGGDASEGYAAGEHQPGHGGPLREGLLLVVSRPRSARASHCLPRRP